MGRTEHSRRGVLALGGRGLAAVGLGGVALPLAACRQTDWYGTDVTGVLPDLSFGLTRARDGVEVTQEDYLGQTVALLFGYTFCPDICPMTLSNLAAVAERLGRDASSFSILFVTVDPERDTAPTLAEYTAALSPRADGLRGTDNQLARLTRRMKVTYKVADHSPGDTDYDVSHGKSVYVFDTAGKARVLWTAFDTAQADIDAATGDVRRVMASA